IEVTQYFSDALQQTGSVTESLKATLYTFGGEGAADVFQMMVDGVNNFMAKVKELVDAVMPYVQQAFQIYQTNIFPYWEAVLGYITDTVLPAFSDALM
ncbi:hypothetical protein, partial [Streptococcus pneumoniae]|uniref:hypothetical protein n=1 Tax=Streptococcus pneumoniae TaxID=1313 RepID=UPI0018B0CF20